MAPVKRGCWVKGRADRQPARCPGPSGETVCVIEHVPFVGAHIRVSRAMPWEGSKDTGT